MPDTATADQPTLDLLTAASTAFRFQHEGIKIDGDTFDIQKFPYLLEPFDLYNCKSEDMPPYVVFRKGSQLGITSYAILTTIDRLTWLYPRAAMYLFPTRDDVTDFSKARFDRIVQENPYFYGLIGNTDAANIKNINGKFLYLRGARTRSQLKGVPVDFLVLDERDEMDDDMVAMAEHRMDQSDFGHQLTLSTPTFPDFGVDLAYQQSDQRMWHLKCQSCGEWTCLEAEWPHSFVRRADGRVYRACKKNPDHEVHPIHGQWVAAYPDIGTSRDVEGKLNGLIGYYVSQLNTSSPTRTPEIILKEHETGFTASGERVVQKEFTNQTLGLGYADIEDKLTVQQVLACCGRDEMVGWHDGPCAMGVDVKKGQYHYIIGTKISEDRYRVVRYGIATSEEEVEAWAKRCHVDPGVMDAKPEINASAAFCARNDNWFACFTSESQKHGADWDYRSHIVKVNRNTSLDKSHQTVVEGHVELPRQTDHLKRGLAQHFTRIARTIKEDDKTGRREAVWIKLGGDDDWRYAWNFFVIAAELVREVRPAKFLDRFRSRDMDRPPSAMAV